MKHEKAIGWMMVKKQCIIECPDDANDASKEIIEAYNMAIEALERQRWIPCNKDLPEKSDRYLAIVLIGTDKFPIVEILVFKKDRGRWFRQGRGNEVIAWMPLPEPYKAGE